MTMCIGDRLRQLIEEASGRGVDQVALAKQIGVSKGTISNWKNGIVRKIYPENLAAAARVFGVNLVWLITGEGQREPPRYASNGTDLDLLYETVTTVLAVLDERSIILPSPKLGRVIVAAYEDALEEASPPRRGRIVRLVQLSQ